MESGWIGSSRLNLLGLLYLLVLIRGIDSLNLDFANPSPTCRMFIPANIVFGNYINITYCMPKGLHQAMLMSKCCI